MRFFSSLSAIALWALLAAPMALAEHPSCHAAEPLRSELARLDPDLSGCPRGEACRGEARARLQELLDENGYDFHLQTTLAHLEGIDRTKDRDTLAAELLALAESRKDDANAWYLAGAVAPDEGGVELLGKALALDPEHPWAHLSMAVRKVRDDPEAAAEGLSHFLDQCPSRLRNTKSYPQRLGQTERWARHLPVVEQAIESLPEIERLASLPNLWQMQFAALPLDRHDALRQQIRSQVQEVRALERRQDPVWWNALSEGYELTGETTTDLEQEWAQQFPCRRRAMDLRIANLMRSYNPEVDDMRLKTKRLDFTDEQLTKVVADIEALHDECPNNRSLASWRFLLLQKDEGASEARVREIAESFLQSQRAQAGSVNLNSPEYQVAKLYVEREMALDRVPDLVEAAREHRPDLSKMRMPDHFRKQMEASQERSQVYLARLAGKAHLALGQKEDAQREAATARDLYLALDWETHGDKLSSLHGDLVPLLESTGLQALPVPETAVAQAENPEPPQPKSWQEVDKALDDFSLTDLRGNTWKRADLADQGVLINFWATWCAPCVAELPEIQALHEELAEVEGLTVVTFNTDSNVGKVQPFLAQRDFDFPVIFAPAFLPPESRSLPQNWIVDRQGVVRKKSLGFSVDGPGKWRHEALKVLKEVAGMD